MLTGGMPPVWPEACAMGLLAPVADGGRQLWMVRYRDVAAVDVDVTFLTGGLRKRHINELSARHGDPVGVNSVDKVRERTG